MRKNNKGRIHALSIRPHIRELKNRGESLYIPNTRKALTHTEKLLTSGIIQSISRAIRDPSSIYLIGGLWAVVVSRTILVCQRALLPERARGAFLEMGIAARFRSIDCHEVCILTVRACPEKRLRSIFVPSYINQFM